MNLKEFEVLYRFENLLNTAPEQTKPYESALLQLDPVVRRTSQDDDYRRNLADIERIWELLGRAICRVKDNNGIWEVQCHHLRCVRGLLILMRNLSVNNQAIPQRLRLHETTVETFLRLVTDPTQYNDMKISLYVAAVSFLYNVTKTTTIHFTEENFATLNCFLQYPLGCQLFLTDQVLYPYVMFFLNLTYNNEFLYYLLKGKNKSDILRHLLIELAHCDGHTESSRDHWGSLLSEKNKISSLDAILLKIWANIIVNGSFGPYLLDARNNDYRRFSDMLRLCQLVITSSENWNKLQLTGVLNWCFQLFKETVRETEMYFEQKIEEEGKARLRHGPLNVCLDILSNLSIKPYVQQYILSYGGIELLILLLRILQQHLIRINFCKGIDGSIKSVKAFTSRGDKVVDERFLGSRIDFTTNQIRSSNFPGTKSLIIEVLTSLAQENTIVKGKVREQHGLELILSNCLIDENDPFIRERSIMCIKFLLKDDSENQNFVAQIEAKNPVPDESLSDAGYEVKIDVNGKVCLKSKK